MQFWRWQITCARLPDSVPGDANNQCGSVVNVAVGGHEQRSSLTGARCCPAATAVLALISRFFWGGERVKSRSVAAEACCSGSAPDLDLEALQLEALFVDDEIMQRVTRCFTDVERHAAKPRDSVASALEDWRRCFFEAGWECMQHPRLARLIFQHPNTGSDISEVGGEHLGHGGDETDGQHGPEEPSTAAQRDGGCCKMESSHDRHVERIALKQAPERGDVAGTFTAACAGAASRECLWRELNQQRRFFFDSVLEWIPTRAGVRGTPHPRFVKSGAFGWT